MQNEALVIIDIQNDITKNYREIVDNLNRAIDWAVAQMYVVYICHHNMAPFFRNFRPGTRGAEIVPELKIVSDQIFIKTKSNALTSKAFRAFIEEKGITNFFVAGADAKACVKSTCYNMAKSGYAVTVLADCVTSYDKKKIPEMLAYYEKKGCRVEELEKIMG